MSKPPGADHGGPGQHAFPQSRHQGGVKVSWGTSGKVSAAPLPPPLSFFPARLYPVVHANARLISEKDLILRGYWFPKKVGTQMRWSKAPPWG